MGETFELRRQIVDITQQSIKILCIGEQEVGKSSFFSQHIQQSASYHFKDSPCEVFLKSYHNSQNRKVWIQFYQLSNTYPQYLGCYMEATYEAIVFFYDMTDKRSRNRLYVWLRLLQQYKKDEMWNFPVLLVGLKKNLIFEEELESVTKDIHSQFQGIFPPQCFLYFGQTADKEQNNLKEFQLFVKRVMSRKNGESSRWQQYKLIKSYKIYRHMYTYYELSYHAVQIMIRKGKQAIDTMNIRGIMQKVSDLYLRFSDKLSDY